MTKDEEYSALLSDYVPEAEIKPWDVFKDPPIKDAGGSMQEYKFLDFMVKALKILAYLITFSVVLMSAVISKGTLLFMTSQIAENNTKPYCNRFLGIHKQFIVEIPRLERTAWMWAIIFTYFFAELMTFMRSLRILLFKTWEYPSFSDAIACFFTESLPTIGNAILVFCILPEMDVIKGVMLTNAVCFVPAIVGFLSRNPTDVTKSSQAENNLKMILDIASILAQTTAFIVWPLIEQKPYLWLIPISLILISFGWWENYVSEDSSVKFIKRLGKVKKSTDNNRYFIYLFLSVWKCALFLISVLIITSIKENRVDFLFDDFNAAFEEHLINVTEIKPVISTMNILDAIQSRGSTEVISDTLTPVWVFLINVFATYTCYAFGKFACKIMIQGFSYAFPINLTVPVTISLLIVFCGKFNADECAFYGVIPSYLFFKIPPVYFLNDFLFSDHSWIWLLWLLSQTWITIHIWTPRCEKLAKTERLYVKPMYDAFLIDQSIGMNRRRDDRPLKIEDEEDKKNDDDDDEIKDEKVSPTKAQEKEFITKIYACGTMWHETKEEMMEFLKSVMRLDEDQCARKLVREELGFIMADYYELETHIFFDDAFLRMHEKDNDPKVNEYVKYLVQAVDEAASDVHQIRMKIRPPKKYVTPYGGRLVWTLPGKTLMVAHLKDKAKIRPKKRWSQVMYMYYLLGHRLMDEEEITPKQKDVMAENTYLLALDGDIDFQPDAVHRLVELMKKNKTLGAACGRIHPLGSGPMVWYQMFEYAVGHWLQKATEHMIGCVLCSPGCFSLFRAKALMDDSVMKKYTTRAEEAIQFVQYDQGEDRWLCTLLLQRGFRVEYSAASDAYTHCPEGFNEFYNQRRRWMPSTTANILDLLMDYKRTIKINDNISRLYILYQIVLMVGTVLGPGTIFLMLVGAFVAAFQLDQWSSFIWNVIPILTFLIVCVTCNSNIQLLFAGIISAIYGLVMMAVLVGVMLQISEDGIMAPSSLFFFCVAGEMIIAALLHPKELNCLVYGIVYYVTVPSMYMLLVIYSVFNLNNISWGTREVTIVPKAVEEEPSENPEEIKEEPKKPNRMFALFGANSEDNAGSFEFSLAGLAKCIFCTYRKNSDESLELVRVNENLNKLSEKLDKLERIARKEEDEIDNTLFQQPKQVLKTTILEGPKGTDVGQLINLVDDPYDYVSQLSDGIDPNSWLEERDLIHGEQGLLTSKEKRFWEELLDRYLHPIEDNKEQVAKDLKDLRDKSAMAFFMLNALFVLVVFLLTLKKDILHIKWPFDVKVNFTYKEDVVEIEMYKQYLELEPIGFVFLIFFASLLVVQFTAMLFHRFGTLSQILSSTYINWDFFVQLDKKHLTEDQILRNDPVKVVKKLCKIKGAEDEDDDEDEKTVLAPDRRKTVKHLAESGLKKQSVNDLFEAFERRTTVARFTKHKNATGRKSMAMAVNNRRSTVQHRRASQVTFNLPYKNNRSFVNGAYDEEEV